MPLTRYQIRNEYGLADPELYKAADKDDPEALLEGVAMAGLVGVLRQLGDLAEFAAEVFHDLHEEVISTAARGHGLMVRVQQLEAEVPSIEKAFLSQTNHTSFFTCAGLDWHPNLQSEQGIITHGDLPRFVMDSYEECRGPPRLFLLDKFDVAGAGACLKRYTDPSVFKVESTASVRSNFELQREKKIRKVKKKGPRWKNGGTPEIGLTSHAKLHQLFLEERIENCFNDPSRLVKLKKRHLNGFVDSKNGKSYMEIFLETPSPEHKMVYEASVAAPTLHLMSDNTNDLGLKILDITTVSPASKSPGRVSTCSSCIAQEEALKRPINGDLSGEVIVKMPESTADDEIRTAPNLHVVMVENQLDYGEGKTESSIDGYRSDEVISEVDNYMDALATMESEIETENELRSKNVNLLKVEKQRSESDAHAEHLETQAQLSDSQSCANSSISDDGNNSFKRERSSFSCSDTVSSLVDNVQYDSEGAAKVLPSIPKVCMMDIENMAFNSDYTSHSHASKPGEYEVLGNTSVDENKMAKSEEASGDSCFLDSIHPQPLIYLESCPSPSLLQEPKLDQISSSQISITETDLGCHKTVLHDVPSETVSGADHTISSYHISDREGVDVVAMSESLLHLSNVLGPAVEIEAVEKVEDMTLQREYQDDRTIDKQPLPEIESCPSFVLPSETSCASTNDSSDDRYNTIVAAEEKYEDLPLAVDFSQTQDLKDDKVVAAEAKYEDLPLAVHISQTQDLKDDNIVAAEAKYEDLPLAVDFSQTQDLKDQVENVADDVLQIEDGLAETDVSYSEREANIVDTTRTADDGKVAILTHANDASDELQLCYPNNTVYEMHLNSQKSVNEIVNQEGTTMPSTAVSFLGEFTSPGDLDHEDSVNCSDAATEKVQADEVVDSVNCSNLVTGKVQADHVVTSTSIVAKTATITEVTPKNLDQFSNKENISIDKLPIGTSQEERFALDADPTNVNDENEVVCTSLNGLSSDPTTVWRNPYPKENGFKYTSDYSVEPVIESKLNHSEVAPAPLDSKDKLVSDYSDSWVIGAPASIDDLSIGTKSLDLRNLELESNSSRQGDCKEGIEFTSPPPIYFSSAIETSNEPSPDLQAECKETELKPADVDVYNSSRLEQCIKVRCPGRIDGEKGELVQFSDVVQQDQNSNCNASEETIRAGCSLSELSIQPRLGELNMTGRTVDTLQPVLPSYILLPEVPQVNLNEMPPLPPLPPMQWRLGRVQQAFPAPPGSEDPLPSILPSKAEEKGIQLESSNAEILQPENPYMCLQDDKLTGISGGHMVHNTMQPSPFSLQLSMIGNENCQCNSATMDKQYNNPFLTLPPMPKEKPEHDSLTSDGETVRSDLNLLSLGPTTEDRTCKIDSGSSYGQSFQPFTNSASESGLKLDMSQHVSQDFEGEQRNPHVMMAPLSFTEDEQSQHDLLTTEQEVASSSHTSFMLPPSGVSGMPNGNPTSKLLRLRSPLIDAVAAHDKSKLRKVSDRILPEIGPKVDERDSLLAQIRTKSFNLKPAVATRPSVQGPKTNLRVAAILEKANAIRQALAGSDEDDDTDSWGDDSE